MDACHAFALNHGMLLGASPNTPPISWGEVHSAAPGDVLPRSGHIAGGCYTSEGEEVHKQTWGTDAHEKTQKCTQQQKKRTELVVFPSVIPPLYLFLR